MNRTLRLPFALLLLALGALYTACIRALHLIPRPMPSFDLYRCRSDCRGLQLRRLMQPYCGGNGSVAVVPAFLPLGFSSHGSASHALTFAPCSGKYFSTSTPNESAIQARSFWLGLTRYRIKQRQSSTPTMYRPSWRACMALSPPMLLGLSSGAIW